MSASSSTLNNFSRILLMVLVLPLLFIAGFQLFILSEHTDVYFSWTIPSPFTASFLGAGYWSAFFAAYFVFRRMTWASVKTSFLPAVLGTGLLGITTFIYLDKFHLHSENLITLFVTWVWIIVYVIAPPLLLLGWILESRRHRGEDMHTRPLSAWVRAWLFILAAFFLLVGIGLFAVPDVFGTFWPWKIVPLSGRAISSWLIAYGAAAGIVAWENDVPTNTGTMWSLIAFSVLQLIVVARYPATLKWDNPLAWVYIVLLVIGLVLNAAGLWKNKAQG